MKWNFLVTSLVTLNAGLVFAGPVQSLHCFEDTRPVDGPLTEFKLTRNDKNLYDAVKIVTLAERGVGEGGETIELGKDMPCVFAKDDERVVNCHRASAPGEEINSGFNTMLVSETSLGSDRELVRQDFINFQAYSPTIPGESHRIDERFGLYQENHARRGCALVK